MSYTDKMKWFMYLYLILVLTACASDPPVATVAPHTAYHGNSPQRLQQHFSAWRGTPYRMGGLNRQGIDCSGFVYVTYRDVYGISLPRTTERLSATGEAITLKQAAPGDLLIFKTGFKQKHVGIYLGGGRFIHASTSEGVITSSLHTQYWSDAYRQARRVLPQ